MVLKLGYIGSNGFDVGTLDQMVLILGYIGSNGFNVGTLDEIVLMWVHWMKWFLILGYIG